MASVATIVGCVDEADSGGAKIITFSVWIPWLFLFGTVSAIIAGWFLRKLSVRYGYGMLLIGVALFVVVSPGIFQDRVLVDDKHFTLQTGFWFSPTHHSVSFSELSKIDIRVQRRRRGVESQFLVCKFRNGRIREVPIGTLMNYAAPVILEKALAAGVEVNDLRS